MSIALESKSHLIDGPVFGDLATILTADAAKFVVALHRNLDSHRKRLLQARIERQSAVKAGDFPDFLPATELISISDWKVAVPALRVLSNRP
jgi:malate synthase